MGCHFLLQGNLPDPGIEPKSPALQVDSLLSEPLYLSSTKPISGAKKVGECWFMVWKQRGIKHDTKFRGWVHWYSNIHFSPVQAAITPFTQQNLFTESGCGPVELWEAVFWSAKSSITTRSYKHHYAPATTLNIRTYFASALNLYSKRNLRFSCCYSSRFRETA